MLWVRCENIRSLDIIGASDPIGKLKEEIETFFSNFILER
jgi:hypothetical protein